MAQTTKAPPKRRCEYCRRAVGTTDPLTGAVRFPLHCPPGGGYCPGSGPTLTSRTTEARTKPTHPNTCPLCWSSWTEVKYASQCADLCAKDPTRVTLRRAASGFPPLTTDEA